MMRQLIQKILGFICALMIALPLWAQHFPHLTGYVVDEANILTDEERYEITQRLQTLQPKQVVVATVQSLDGYNIDEYANLLFRHWGLGDKERNDGVLILFAPNERALRIEVGYGLEETLTDALSSQIVHLDMIPLAKQNKFGPALIAGTKSVADVLSGNTPIHISSPGPSTPNREERIFFLSILMFISSFIPRFCSVFKPIKNNSFLNYLFFIWLVVGMSAFYVPFFYFFPVIFYPFFIIHYILLCGIFIFACLKKNPWYPLNALNSLQRSRGKGSSGGFSGGSFGGRSGGGFSGGGGSSGGGGASGHF